MISKYLCGGDDIDSIYHPSIRSVNLLACILVQRRWRVRLYKQYCFQQSFQQSWIWNEIELDSIFIRTYNSPLPVREGSRSIRTSYPIRRNPKHVKAVTQTKSARPSSSIMLNNEKKGLQNERQTKEAYHYYSLCEKEERDESLTGCMKSSPPKQRWSRPKPSTTSDPCCPRTEQRGLWGYKSGVYPDKCKKERSDSMSFIQAIWASGHLRQETWKTEISLVLSVDMYGKRPSSLLTKVFLKCFRDSEA